MCVKQLLSALLYEGDLCLPVLLLQELNSRGSHLMFRDKSHQLHLFNLATQQQTNLLSFCQYVQWVPDSDVVVAQSRSSLYVWYSISNADR
jgi:intraflagellar transport protein 172